MTQHYTKLEDIIEFFEKDIKSSEKRKEEIRKIEFTPVELKAEHVEMMRCIVTEQVLRHVISKLKQFNNQKKEIGRVSIPAGEYFVAGLPNIFSSKEEWDTFLEKDKKEMEGWEYFTFNLSYNKKMNKVLLHIENDGEYFSKKINLETEEEDYLIEKFKKIIIKHKDEIKKEL